jgi:hypothetical protein
MNNPGKPFSHRITIPVQKSFGVMPSGYQYTVKRNGRKHHCAVMPFQIRPGCQNLTVFISGIGPYLICGFFSK